MKKIIIVAIISAFALMLGGCSSKNESGVEISKGWFAMNQRSDSNAL